MRNSSGMSWNSSSMDATPKVASIAACSSGVFGIYGNWNGALDEESFARLETVTTNR